MLEAEDPNMIQLKEKSYEFSLHFLTLSARQTEAVCKLNTYGLTQSPAAGSLTEAWHQITMYCKLKLNLTTNMCKQLDKSK